MPRPSRSLAAAAAGQRDCPRRGRRRVGSAGGGGGGAQAPTEAARGRDSSWQGSGGLGGGWGEGRGRGARGERRQGGRNRDIRHCCVPPLFRVYSPHCLGSSPPAPIAALARAACFPRPLWRSEAAGRGGDGGRRGVPHAGGGGGGGGAGREGRGGTSCSQGRVTLSGTPRKVRLSSTVVPCAQRRRERGGGLEGKSRRGLRQPGPWAGASARARAACACGAGTRGGSLSRPSPGAAAAERAPSTPSRPPPRHVGPPRARPAPAGRCPIPGPGPLPWPGSVAGSGRPEPIGPRALHLAGGAAARPRQRPAP